jgi:hypothetical protein
LPEQRISVSALFPGTVAKAAIGASSPYEAVVQFELIKLNLHNSYSHGGAKKEEK